MAEVATVSKSSNNGIFPKPTIFGDRLLTIILIVEVAAIVHTLHTDPQMLVILAAMILFVAVLVHVTKYCFCKFGLWLSRSLLPHLGNPLGKAKTMRKWNDQAWQLTIHFTMAIFELIVLSEETWWQDTRSLWNENDKIGGWTEHRFRTKMLYITQLAIWLFTAFSCKYFEEHRKDYFLMMLHHVVTIALVTWSYALGFLPVGVIVLFLHDISDIPLDLLKMSNYLKLEGRSGFFICELLFIILIFDWFYFRVYLYPSKLLYTTLLEVREITISDQAIARDLTILFPHPGPPLWISFNALLITLYCLHLWWALLIIRLLHGVIMKSVHETAKDEYEGSSEEEDDDENDNVKNSKKTE